MKKVWTTCALVAMTLLTTTGMAQAADGGEGGGRGLVALGAGLGLGIAAAGAGLGQGRAVAAAMESIGRNPNAADRVQTPMIIGIAFMEALAIYALVIAFTLSRKV